MPSPIRFTKIVATLGPATETADRIEALVRAGANVFRLNASHGTTEWRAHTLEAIREAGRCTGRTLGVLLDLAGPKVRVAALTDEPLQLDEGATITISRNGPPTDGPGFSVTMPEAFDNCAAGHRVLLDDGATELRVTGCESETIRCTVEVGGKLWPNKGINLPDTRLTLPGLTEKDLDDLAWGLEAGVDYIGLSFVRSADEVTDLRRRIGEAESEARVVAKIERPEAVEHITEIITAADAIMMARGDLGVEMDVARVPLIQKRVTRLARAAGKPLIVATQMLQSMINSPSPTRAEVSDIANAILDGADAVMLSGETSIGEYPVRAVQTMDRVANLTEDHEREFAGWTSERPAAATIERAIDNPQVATILRTEATLAAGAGRIADDVGAGAVVVLSHRGVSALAVSKQRPDVPIVGVSDREATCRRMTLYRGVFPVHHAELIGREDLRDVVGRLLHDGQWVEPGTAVVIISGWLPGESGSSDMLQIHRV